MVILAEKADAKAEESKVRHVGGFTKLVVGRTFTVIEKTCIHRIFVNGSTNSYLVEGNTNCADFSEIGDVNPRERGAGTCNYYSLEAISQCQMVE